MVKKSRKNLYIVQVKVNGKWEFGPRLCGLDPVFDLVSPMFMTKQDAELLYRKCISNDRYKKENLRIVHYKFQKVIETSRPTKTRKQVEEKLKEMGAMDVGLMATSKGKL